MPDKSFPAKIGDRIDVTADMKATGKLEGCMFHKAEPSIALTISDTGSNIIKLYYPADA